MNNVAVARARDYSRQAVDAALDQVFVGLGLNPANPFASMVEPGQMVFIKPNWVAHRYRASCGVQDSLWSTITHPMVIEAVAVRVQRALKGSGEIYIGDNPSIDCNFGELIANSELADLPDRMEVPTHLVDLRPLVCADLADYGQKDRMVPQEGDPRGSIRVNLGRDSMLHGLDAGRFRGVFTDTSETVAAHSGDQQWYEISASIAEADLYISIPKLKTHHKVATTLNLKGLVGTVANKNLLVHWRTGYPEVGGDEYPDRATWERMQHEAIQKRGAWPGNDTIWRMVVDLYTILLRLRGGRPNFCIIDGVVGGQGEGPFCPRSKESGVLIGSRDLLAADVVASRAMGFSVPSIPYLAHYLDTAQIDPAALQVAGLGWAELLQSTDRCLGFDPPKSWAGAMV